MDFSQIKPKLVGSDDERAVSPVIGVILMVAITVILAAVIAAFVLDLGDSVGEEAQAGVTLDVDETADGNITVGVTSLGNADYVNITGDVRNEGAEDTGDEFYMDGPEADSGDQFGWDDVEDDLSELEVGDTITIGSAAGDGADVYMGDAAPADGTITVIAVIEEDDTTTQVGSEDYDLDWETYVP